MKICDLTQFYSPVGGGVKRYLEQKVAYLRKHEPDCKHLLIIPGESTEKKGDDHSCVYTIAGPLISRTSRYRILTRLHLLEEILETEKPDIIEVGDPYQIAWKAIASGRALSIPVVAFYHSHFPEAYIRSVAKYFGRITVQIAEDICRTYIKSLYNRFERTFVPSPALATLLRAWGVEQVTNIDLGVDTDVFYPKTKVHTPWRHTLGIPDDRILLLYVGRLATEKNVRTLFDAIGLLYDRAPERYHLLVIGDGTRRSDLQKIQQRTGIVSWLPYCQDAVALAEAYRHADLFVHPGICETFGLVALESQACGTPVVGIRGSYMDRIILNNQLSWASENSAFALANAIEEMTIGDLYTDGLQASEAVRRRYAWNSVFSKLFSIYRNVIAEYVN